MRIKKSKCRILFYLMVCLLGAASVGWPRSRDALEQLALLQDVRHEIVQGYVEDADQEKMMEAAVHAMVRSLDDR